jgi:hypothetical protein
MNISNVPLVDLLAHKQEYQTEVTLCRYALMQNLQNKLLRARLIVNKGIVKKINEELAHRNEVMK